MWWTAVVRCPQSGVPTKLDSHVGNGIEDKDGNAVPNTRRGSRRVTVRICSGLRLSGKRSDRTWRSRRRGAVEEARASGARYRERESKIKLIRDKRSLKRRKRKGTKRRLNYANRGIREKKLGKRKNDGL